MTFHDSSGHSEAWGIAVPGAETCHLPTETLPVLEGLVAKKWVVIEDGPLTGPMDNPGLLAAEMASEGHELFESDEGFITIEGADDSGQPLLYAAQHWTADSGEDDEW